MGQFYSGSVGQYYSGANINALEDVRREMASVYREARAGRMDASEAGRLAYILTGIGKLIEATEIERRLSQMEMKLLK